MKYLLLILLFISCSNKLRVYTEMQENSKIALDKWAIIEKFEYRFVDSYNHCGDAEIFIFRRPSNSMILGQYGSAGVMDSIDNWAVIAHELGHHFGYKHSDNPNSIMHCGYSECATQFIDLVKMEE